MWPQSGDGRGPARQLPANALPTALRLSVWLHCCLLPGRGDDPHCILMWVCYLNWDGQHYPHPLTNTTMEMLLPIAGCMARVRARWSPCSAPRLWLVGETKVIVPQPPSFCVPHLFLWFLPSPSPLLSHHSPFQPGLDTPSYVPPTLAFVLQPLTGPGENCSGVGSVGSPGPGSQP